MSEEELRKLAREEMLDTIHNNLDSAMILTYVKGLEDRIDKAIEYIKNNWYSKNTRNIEELHSLGDWRLDLLEILGDKENE